MEERTIQLQGLAGMEGRTVRYIDQGVGPEVLLLHGWGAPAATYRLIIEHLAERCRVVAPDLPGFGGSDEPDRAWSADDFADFVVAFCRQVGLTAPILIGHSHGGRIAIKLLSRPDRPLAISKAVLMDAAGLKIKHGLWYYIKVYSYKAAKRLCPPLARRLAGRTGSADYRSASPLMRQTMVRQLGEDLRPLLPRITVPVLLIWGDQDTATPLYQAKIMEREIPDAGLAVLPGAGHFAFAERWAQCRRILDAFIP